MKSDWMPAFFFSHHSFSEAVFDVISPRRSRRCVFCAISEADWKMVWPQLGAKALACSMSVRIQAIAKQYRSTYLVNNIPQLLLNLLLRALEPLPQVVAHTAPLQQHLERLLRVPDLHDAMDVFCRTAQ
jgi:hypothetical protein